MNTMLSTTAIILLAFGIIAPAQSICTCGTFTFGSSYDGPDNNTYTATTAGFGFNAGSASFGNDPGANFCANYTLTSSVNGIIADSSTSNDGSIAAVGGCSAYCNLAGCFNCCQCCCGVDGLGLYANVGPCVVTTTTEATTETATEATTETTTEATTETATEATTETAIGAATGPTRRTKTTRTTRTTRARKN